MSDIKLLTLKGKISVNIPVLVLILCILFLSFEPQILDYQTQQYRLFSGLASCYSLVFATQNLTDTLVRIQSATDNLRKIPRLTLAKVNELNLLKYLYF